MGSCCGGSAPQPPNPIQTAAAQTGTNVSTAIANSYLGNINQQTPQGSLTYDVGSNFNYTDPTTGQSFSIPRWTATQTPTAQGQQAINNQQATQVNLSEMAKNQSGMLGNILGASFNPNQGGNFQAGQYLAQNPDVMAAAQKSGQNIYDFAAEHYRVFGQNEGRMASASTTPGMGDIHWLADLPNPQFDIGQSAGPRFEYGSGGDITRSFDPNSAGQIQQRYGAADNYSADRNRIEAGLMERMNPQLKIEQDRLRQQLADQGINYGSSAYTNAMDVYNRQANDARLGVIGAAGSEQQRMDEMARNQAMFGNAAQQQGYAEQLGLGQFQNQAQAQAEGQAAARAGFFNQAAQQQFGEAQARGSFFNQAANQMLNRNNTIFNAQNQLRNQNLQEQYQQRNQPINEITALLSGGQVSQPNFINAQKTTIPTTDIAGLINQNFAQQNDVFKTQQGFWGDIIGGALGATGRIAASDERIKENVEPMGSVLTRRGELPIYRYDYKDDNPDGARHVGPMAQDVEKLDPSSVLHINGVKHIDLERMGSIFGGA